MERDRTAVVQGLNAALKEARRAAQGRPLVVQITECQAFIHRSQNRLRQMEEERMKEKALDGALARLSRLREEMARNPDLLPNVMSPAPTQPALIPSADPSAEIRQLRARLAEVELERDALAKKRARSPSVPSTDIAVNQSISVMGIQQVSDRRSAMMQTVIGQGSSLGHIKQPVQPIGTVNAVKSRYGLRGVRVGEASHPGPDSLPDEELVTREDSERSRSKFGNDVDVDEVVLSLADTESINGVERG